ncbi:MAG: VOC family protein [Pseudomonadota bacterium]
MTQQTTLLLIAGLFFVCGTASAQIEAAPWPDQAPAFDGAVFARAGITVRDIDESLVFYRDILGLDVIHDRKGLFDPRLKSFSGMTENETIRLVILRPSLTNGQKFHAGYIALSERSNKDGDRIEAKETVQHDGIQPGAIMLQFMVDDAKRVHQAVLKLDGYEVIAAPDPDKPFGELLVRDPNNVRFWITDRYGRHIFVK